MRISSHEFGRIVVDGQVHAADLIVHPGRIEGAWRRLQGHYLHIRDLETVWDSSPDTLIVGTGYHDRMVVPEETRDLVRELGVHIHAAPTGRAVELFNRLTADPAHKVVAALHLTC